VSGRPRLTVDGLRDMILDLKRSGVIPVGIVVSEIDKIDLKFDIMAYAEETSPDAEETVDMAIAIIEGVPVVSSPTQRRGVATILKAWKH